MGRGPLHIAAASGNISTIQLILQMPGVVVDLPSVGLETPLMRAVQFSRGHAVLALLQAGADPLGPRNVSGLNALDFARITKNGDIENLLMQAIEQRQILAAQH